MPDKEDVSSSTTLKNPFQEDAKTISRLNLYAKDRTQFAQSVLNPIENMTQFAQSVLNRTQFAQSVWLSADGSPTVMMSPWNQNSPFPNSPWSQTQGGAGNNAMANNMLQNLPQNNLIGSLVREERHIYSLAARDKILYTGSDSKNIRVWKDMKEFATFKSNSGLVKAIVISGDKIFTGHQDGKIRVWKVNSKNLVVYKRVGTMPTFFDIFKASFKRSTVYIKHFDAISSLSMDAKQGLLYSASWDRTFKVWKTKSSKCSLDV